MLLDHHILPFATSHYIIICIGQELVTCEAGFNLVSPLIGCRIPGSIQMMVHRLCIIHFIQIGHCLHREENQLEICILDIFRKRQILPQSLGLKLEILVRNLFPLTCMEVIGMTVKHFRCNTAVIFAV